MIFAKNSKLLTNILLFSAFTLAEVLIVLGIIGIIAELTIPSLIANYQKTLYVTGLKKAYTTFNQALIQMAADNGCIGDLKCTGVFASGTTQESAGDELVKYFKVTKNCKTGDGQGCFSNNVSDNYNGSGTRGDWYDSSGYGYGFITADGMAFKIGNWENNCGSDADGYSNHVTNNMTQMCAEVKIDVNGPIKGPNNVGRDIFFFWITNGKGPVLYPLGGADCAINALPWQKSSGKIQACYPGLPNGASCAGRVMEESWQMNY